MTDLRTFTISGMDRPSDATRPMESAYRLIQSAYNVMGTGFGRMTYESLMDCLEGLDVARVNLSEAADAVLEEAVRKAKAEEGDQ